MRDPQALTEMSEDVDTRLTQEQRLAARNIICGNAIGKTLKAQVADAEDMMKMLGVHPSQDDDEDYPIAPTIASIAGSHPSAW